MLASTAGPPMNPVLAATSSRPASSASTAARTLSDSDGVQCRLSRMDLNTTAFRVCPSTGCADHSRYSRMMPLAVKASDAAMYSMVQWPVRTRGSASRLTLLETASMPV